MLLNAGSADALDHRGVVLRIGEDDAARQQPGQRAQGRLVGDVAGGEEQGGRLAVPVGQLALQEDVVVVGAGDIARAPRAGAALGEGADHGGDDLRVLAHAEVVVAAPDHDLFSGTGAAGNMPQGDGKAAGAAFEVGKDAIAALGLQGVDRALEQALVVHGSPPERLRAIPAAGCATEVDAPRWLNQT